MHFRFVIYICVIEFQIFAHFRLFEGRALIQGGRLFDNSMSSVGAYSKGRLIEALRYGHMSSSVRESMGGVTSLPNHM